ncbi:MULTISPECIES: hypothetical protein [Terrabacteria group]|uniref:hypothetical protein n=1 Tax=Bacillati TaxID=1783272 RepID=UPI00193A43E6|nr:MULTISPECIES: hypothetical protein [Terrabacteria group]MBW9212861.1 hypothetical protein [Trueperella sp. zg.1013]QRG86465.1 hypothetical protein JOS54_06340 [Bulleidia sp. zg-1006]
MKKSSLVILLAVCLSACSMNKGYQEPKVDTPLKIESSVSLKGDNLDAKAYAKLPGKLGSFQKVSFQQALKFIQDKGTGMFYFGKVDSLYEQAILPELNEAMKRSNVSVYYISTNEEVKEKDYQEMVKLLASSLKKDKKGNLIFLTPFVVSVKQGKVVDSQISLKNNQIIKDEKDTLSNDVKKEMQNRYLEMFKKIAS